MNSELPQPNVTAPPPQPDQPPASPPSDPKRWLPWAVAGAILVVVSATAGAVWYRVLSQQPGTTISSQPEVAVESVSPSAQPEPALTVGGQAEKIVTSSPVPDKSNSATTTYVSKDYGFTLQYPSDWSIQDNRYSIIFLNTPFSDSKTVYDISKRDYIMLAIYRDEEFRNKSTNELIEEKLVPADSGQLTVINSTKINNFEVVETREGVALRFIVKHDNLLLDFVVQDRPNKEKEIAIIKQMIASLQF